MTNPALELTGSRLSIASSLFPAKRMASLDNQSVKSLAASTMSLKQTTDLFTEALQHLDLAPVDAPSV